MANLMDYLDWWGGITFSQVPLCDVDNLIFCKMAFIDLSGILPEYGTGGVMTLGEAARRYADKNKNTKVNLGLLVPAEIHDMFLKMATCDRYRHLLLSEYVNHIDTERQEQFSAVTVFLNAQEMYIAFRGTDDTIIGWKENFNMSHLEAVPAQLEAIEYVNGVMTRCRHPRVYLGGHSKGGNLAIFAAVRSTPEQQARIVRVYNNDGPGFRKEFVSSPSYREMESRICTLIPQSSVVGRLLEHDENYRVVKSNASGLWQHNGFTWEVMGGKFLDAEALTRDSLLIEQSLKSWIASMDENKREEFVDALYAVLTATNATTLTELTADRTWLLKLLRGSDPAAKKMVLGGLAQLTGEAGRLWAETVLPLIKGKILPAPKGGPEG